MAEANSEAPKSAKQHQQQEGSQWRKDIADLNREIGVVIGKGYPGLKRKIVLITGGSSGIGFAAAVAFARCGSQVIVAARDSSNHPLSVAVQRLNMLALGDCPKVVGRKCDVSDSIEVKSLIQFVYENFGRLDIAVHAAGVIGWNGKLCLMPADVILGSAAADPIRTNLYGTITAMTAELALWKQHHNPGIIVNVASSEGLRGCAGAALFSAAMHGVVGITKSAALECIGPPRIRINAVAPGPVDTPSTWNLVKLPSEQPWEGPFIGSRSDPSWRDNADGFARMISNVPRLRAVPDGRLLSPADVAGTILFLASDAAASITGAVIPIDTTASAGWPTS